MKKLSKSTLRWYISTKTLMPIVEIRRRFGLDGEDVSVVQHEGGKVYVGLPQHAAQALDELRQQGKIEYEFSAEFHARVLVGAYVVHRKNGSDQQPGQTPDDTGETAA